MKISKRILGVAVALIMIFNVFAIGTFAAFPDDTVVKLQVTADKAVYAPGDIITLTVSEQVIAEVGDMLIGGQYDFGYDGAAIELLSNDTETLESHGFVAIAPGYDAGISGVQLPSQSGVSEINGWTDAVTFNVGYDGTPFDATSMTELFTVQFKVKADAEDGTYTIGFNPAGYEGYSAYSADAANEGLYGPFGADMGFEQENMYEYGTCEIKISSAPAVEVTHDGTQARYAYPGTPSAAAYQFGCLGKVTGLTVETDADNNVTNIQSIVATANYNGATVSSTVATMWVDGEAYGFRAVFKGFDYQDTKDISVTFAITMADGTTVYTTADAATYTANGIYTAAVGRGMPEIA